MNLHINWKIYLNEKLINMPKVSVVIPTYNRPQLVMRAIRSVLNQSLQDFEILVVDDGLKERAEQAVNSFHDKRIIYFKNKENLGAPASRNIGITNARGT